MTISDYLELMQMSQADLAKQLGVSQGAVSHWVTGRVLPRAQHALLLEQITGGRVRRHETRPDVYPPD